MIKKLFTLGLALAAFGATAQEQIKLSAKTFGSDVRSNHVNMAAKLGHIASTYSVTVDTLWPSTLASSTSCGITQGIHEYLAYSTPDSGYAFGSSVAQTFTYNLGTVVTITATTSELAQRYNIGSSSATITDVLVWSGVGAGNATTISANIYDVDAASGQPNNVLGTSTSMALSAIAPIVANGDFTDFNFSTPVAVSANIDFFASVTIPDIGGADQDTMDVLTTKVGCNSGDSLAWINTRLDVPGFGTQYQWSSEKSLYGAANNLDFMIFPVINIATSGINDYVKHGGLSLYAAYPNPANSSITVNFALEKASSIEIKVYDITGKAVKTINNNAISGKNNITLDVTNLEAGSYIYSINAGENKMFSKFIVTK